MFYIILNCLIWHIQFVLDSDFQKIPDVAFAPKVIAGISFEIHQNSPCTSQLELWYQFQCENYGAPILKISGIKPIKENLMPKINRVQLSWYFPIKS